MSSLFCLQMNGQNWHSFCLSVPSMKALLTSLRRLGSSTWDLESCYWTMEMERSSIRSGLIAITRLQILCMRFWRDGFVELGDSQWHGRCLARHWEQLDSLNWPHALKHHSHHHTQHSSHNTSHYISWCMCLSPHVHNIILCTLFMQYCIIYWRASCLTGVEIKWVTPPHIRF